MYWLYVLCVCCYGTVLCSGMLDLVGKIHGKFWGNTGGVAKGSQGGKFGVRKNKAGHSPGSFSFVLEQSRPVFGTLTTLLCSIIILLWT